MILFDLVLPSGDKRLHPESVCVCVCVCVCVGGRGRGESLHVPPCGFLCMWFSPLSHMPRAIKSPLWWWTVEGRQPLAPRLKTWVGGGSVKVGIKGRAVREKIKKPSDLFVGDVRAAQQDGQYLASRVRKSVTF